MSNTKNTDGRGEHELPSSFLFGATQRGSLLRWSCWSWRSGGCSRVTVARGPSLMASGASRCPPIPTACSGGRSGAGGRRSGVWSCRSGRAAGDDPGRIAPIAPKGVLAPSSTLPPNLLRRLVLAQADKDRVAQKVVSRPGQIGDLCDKRRINPMHPGKNQRRAETGLTRRRDVQRRCLAGQRI